MRGFPLLNTLLVLAGFALAWWPLHQSATGSSAGAVSANAAAEESRETTAIVEADAEPGVDATLKVFSSRPLVSLRVETLGETLIEFSAAPENEGAIEKALPAFAIPEEGVEFWVEATFAPASKTENSNTASSALGVELAPDDRDARTVTLWTDEFDSESVADSVVFTWE